MGLLCELFVAKHRNALKFERHLETAAPPTYERGEAKGLLPISFEVLWAVMDRKPFDPYTHTLPDLYFWSHARTGLGRLRQRIAIWKAMALAVMGKEVGNTWLHQFPPPLVRMLSSLTDTEADEIAEKWSQTDDMAKLGSAVAYETLQTLRMLARKAQDSGNGLYVWGTL